MLTRRGFLGGAIQVAGVVSLAAGQSLVTRPSKQPAVPSIDVIDCHTHFYDPERPQGIPWPEKGSSLYRTVLPEHLRALPHAIPVTGTIIVEASSWLEDNQWLLDIADDDPFVVGIVGHLNPGSDTFADHLKRFSRTRLFRGIRVGQGLVTELMTRKNLQDFRSLVDYDLELDVNGGPTMPEVVGKLAEQIPDLRLVVNHIGNVRITDQKPPGDWVRAIEKASRGKNVFCKVSALVEGAVYKGDKAPDDVEFYRPYLDVVWDAFGDDRLIYGSDWPVSERAADYDSQQQVVLDYVSGRGKAATHKFFSLNSRQAYKWEERPGRRVS